MECAGKASRTPCCGPPIRRCHRCSAVAYCSPSHQVSHWSLHKRECQRLAHQIKTTDLLNNFPFTFTTLESTQSHTTRCSFLTDHKIHRTGMWNCECSCWKSDFSTHNSISINGWDLSSELCPCKAPSSPAPVGLISSWKEYYEWRCIPFHSPVALLLHWPLTVYRALKLANVNEIGNELRIHYLGPEKELLQLQIFAELLAFFPRVRVCVDFVGPAIPRERDGEVVDLFTYARCNEVNCECKCPVEGESGSGSVRLRLHAGCYHECYRELVKDSVPDVIIAPNAGLAVYTSWLPTIELIKEIEVPVVFSDYCEEACNLAASCLRSVTGCDLSVQVQINPFRQPIRVEESALLLPCFSNCFLFGF